MKALVGKVMWMGRATVFLVGFAVILAAVMGVASMALAANGKPFILGKSNVATKISKLVKSGAGPALDLQVDSGPPLAVNSAVKVANLNADQLDGFDSTVFMQNGQFAAGDLTGTYPAPQVTGNAISSLEIQDSSLRMGDISAESGPVTLNPPSVPGQSCVLVSASVTGVAPNDVALVFPSTSLDASLTIQPVIQDSVNTLSFRLCNESSSAVDDGSEFFNFMLFRP